LPCNNLEPFPEELSPKSPHLLNLRIGEGAWRKPIELLRRPEHSRTPLGIEEPYYPLHFQRFFGERTTRAFAGGVLKLPPFGNQTKESTPVTKCRLDRIVRQIVQSEMRAVFRLLLPRYGPVFTGAAQHTGAIRPFGYFNL